MQRQGLERLKKHQKQGLSLPFVACASAFLLAFALALVYTAGVMLSNANHKLAEERCYQLAKSFAEVVDKELKKPGSSFYTFANRFLNSADYHEYKPDHLETVYHHILQQTEGDEDENYGKVSIQLRKEINDDNLAGLNDTIPTPGAASDINYTESIKTLKEKKFLRYLFTVEVTAEQGGLTYDYTTEYYREDQYEVKFRYGEQDIVWDDKTNQWRQNHIAGPVCKFDSGNTQITYTYDIIEDPVSTEFVPVYKEGGAS